MEKHKTALIVGAGAGGLATALYLAGHGYHVEVFEKNAFPGGRCGKMEKDGYRFDLGATMLMMPGIYRKVFDELGLPLFGEEGAKPLKDLYTLHFDEGSSFVFTTEEDRMKEQLEKLEPGSFSAYKSFVKKGYAIFQTGLEHFIGRNFLHWYDFIHFRNLFLLFRLKTYLTNDAYVRKFFHHPHLRMAFTFQNIYVGQSPFQSPALFSMVPAAELTEGTFYLKGGMASLVDKLMEAGEKRGVVYHLNTPVARVLCGRNRVEGLVLEDGRKILADIVVSNADLPYTYRSLLPAGLHSRRLDNLAYSSSALCFHWGLDKTYPQLGHHNVFLSDRYKEGMRALFREKTLPESPSFYVHAPVRSDPSAAPPGHDALSVIVGAGHVDPARPRDWERLRNAARTAVIQRLQQMGMEDLEEHICFETCHTPPQWMEACNISRGAVFGSVAHHLHQMGYFRPHNRHSRYKNLYFVGGSTHPGNGIPNVLLSARLTSERIFLDNHRTR